MNLPTTRRSFADDLRDMNRLMSRVFNRPFAAVDFDDGLELSTPDWTPSMDVGETDRAYLIRAELPQMKREDIKINVQNGILVLSGERKQEKDEKGKKWHRVERSYGLFTRSFRLPDDVDQASIDATYNDGMLELVLPKSAKPKGNGHEIKIH